MVAEELERLADADELPMVTVTSVEVAADMRTAVVFWRRSTTRPPRCSKSDAGTSNA